MQLILFSFINISVGSKFKRYYINIEARNKMRKKICFRLFIDTTDAKSDNYSKKKVKKYNENDITCFCLFHRPMPAGAK